MKFGKLSEITGSEIRRWYEDLKKSQEGCCSLCFESDDKYNYAVCMGFTNTGEGPKDKNYVSWGIAWKIGRQTHNNIMQCDLDIDFEMPYDPETGDVDDTESIVEPAPKTPEAWDALAKEIRSEAQRIWDTWKEVSDE